MVLAKIPQEKVLLLDLSYSRATAPLFPMGGPAMAPTLAPYLSPLE